MEKVLKELSDSRDYDNSKNQAVKRNINASVNANTYSIYRNSDSIYYHDFAQNPVDRISDEQM